jgi:outer membrane protein OmpA-like peptidoglycan-associated protein
MARAQSVLSYFTAKGIDRSRFEVAGLGEDFPVADNSTEEGRSKNRRVRIIRLN